MAVDRLAAIGPDRDRIEIVPNGIDVEQVRTAPLPGDDGDGGYDVCFAGRLIEHKNVDLLLDAFDRVAADTDATLGIVGDGPERDALEAQADELTHADRVEFLGFLDDYEDVLGHMRAADVFCSPSTREGFGITFIEAMAADCTVIAAAHPDSAADEVIADAGFCVEPTVNAIAGTLGAALGGTHPPTAAVDHARQYHGDAIAEQAETTYRRAVDGVW